MPEEKRIVAKDYSAWQSEVINKDLTAPPGGASKGDRYIVGPSATGLWSGHDGELTEYSGVAWLFFTPEEGWQAYDLAEKREYIYRDAQWKRLNRVIAEEGHRMDVPAGDVQVIEPGYQFMNQFVFTIDGILQIDGEFVAL